MRTCAHTRFAPCLDRPNRLLGLAERSVLIATVHDLSEQTVVKRAALQRWLAAVNAIGVGVPADFRTAGQAANLNTDLGTMKLLAAHGAVWLAAAHGRCAS